MNQTKGKNTGTWANNSWKKVSDDAKKPLLNTLQQKYDFMKKLVELTQ